MRLIDADALIEHLKEYKTIYGTPMTNRDEQVVHFMIGHIKNLEPTAYDVGVVVSELEKKMFDSSGVYYCGERNAYEKAIEIVRGKE